MKTLIRLGTRPLKADLNLRWAHSCQFVGFCHDVARIMAEPHYGRVILEMTQWKNFMSASAWVQVLDFTKSFVYSNCQNDRTCLFFFFFFFFFFVLFCFFFRLCAMYAFYHCLFIISGGFEALHQLSVKKWSFGNTASKAWKQQMRSFMRDNGRCDILHAT